MDDDPAPRRSLFAVWRWPRWTWAVIVPLLIVSYSLSIGPAVWLHRSGYLPPEGRAALEMIYTPLEFAVEQTDVVEPLVEWYIDLWSDRR